MNDTPTKENHAYLAWAWVGVGGAAFALLGSLLPWATITSVLGSIDISGTHGDGKITAVLALASGAALLAAAVTTSEPNAIAAGVIAAIGVAIVLYDLLNVSRVAGQTSNPFVHVEVGIGMYFCLIGFAVATAGAFISRAGPKLPKVRIDIPPSPDGSY